MENVVAGEIKSKEPLLVHPSPAPLTLRRVFESEEVGLFHISLEGTNGVRIGHDRLMCLLVCLQGSIALREAGRELTIEVGGYATLAEGQVCDIAAPEASAQALLFVGFEQLRGAFFNSYGPADV